MMKPLLLVLVCLMVLGIATTAYGEGIYVGGNLALAMPSDSNMKIAGLAEAAGTPVGVKVKLSKGMALGGVVGYDFGGPRIEAEISYQKNDLDKLRMSAAGVDASAGMSGNMASFALLGSAYYDFYNESEFSFYLSGGVGFAKVDINDLAIEDVSGSEDADDTAFGYHVGFGVGYAASERVTIDVKYRYLATADLEFEDGVEAEFSSHNVLMGVRISF